MTNSSENNQFLLSLNERNLDRVIRWVVVIDSKAKFILTIILVVFGFLITQIQRFIALFSQLWTQKEYSLGIIMGVLLLLLLLFFSLTLIYLLLIIFPKRNPYTQGKSHFFYQTISQMAAKDFSKKMRSIKISEAIDELIDQTYDISKVIEKKFNQLSISIMFFSISLTILIIFLILQEVLLK